MEYNRLGKTQIEVSRMCFGVLTVGPLQANLPVAEGSAVIRHGLECGISFLDTAQYYQTYPYIRHALKSYDKNPVIASKSYAYTEKMMKAAVEEARREMDRDVVDIFLLHEQESALTIKGHWEAFEYLLKCKAAGIIRAAGISTHTVAGVRAAALIPEIDIIHPLFNRDGIGLCDGSVEDMAAAIKEAALAGKGIYGMKPLGGGNLLRDVEGAMNFVLSNHDLHAIAVGMKSQEEVEMNLSIFSGQPVSETVKSKVSAVPRALHIESWCTGCGACIKRCSAGAISLKAEKAMVDKELCRLCGYCGPVCKEFCIKIV